jgi:hypothetical protein
MRASIVTDFAAVMFLFLFMSIMLFTLTYAANFVIQTELNLGLMTTNSQAYILGESVLHNFYLFNDFGPLIFFGLNILAVFLAAYLRPSIMNVAVGLILIWFVPILGMIVSNVARTVFLSTILGPTAMQFPNILLIAAQFPLYTIAFTLLYIVVIAVRSRYYKGSQPVTMDYGA